jgi:hypothetical protein
VETGDRAASARGFAVDGLAMPELNRHILRVPMLEQLLR